MSYKIKRRKQMFTLDSVNKNAIIFADYLTLGTVINHVSF